jgi:hypothetical protein
VKLKKSDLENTRRSAFDDHDKDAVLSLFRHSVALGHKVKACIRFLVAKRLGAQVSKSDTDYQEHAWASLGERKKEHVRQVASSFLKD